MYVFFLIYFCTNDKFKYTYLQGNIIFFIFFVLI